MGIYIDDVDFERAHWGDAGGSADILVAEPSDGRTLTLSKIRENLGKTRGSKALGDGRTPAAGMAIFRAALAAEPYQPTRMDLPARKY